MVKEIRADANTWYLLANRRVFVKFCIVILICFVFRLLIFQTTQLFSFPVLPVKDVPTFQVSDNPTVSEKGKLTKDNESEKCNIFVGEWVPNPWGPVYTGSTCRVVEDQQNCMKNERPDSGYLYWKWKPRDCELPKLDAERFLEAMRNKIWAFVGDSISRNHAQSLICMLSTVEEGIEVYRDAQYKSKKWLFPTYNFTISVVWSPFLVKADIFEDNNGVSSADLQVYLDVIDKKWTEQYETFDYMVIAGGKWYFKTAIYWENNTIQGCHYCPKRNLTQLGFVYSYRKALQLVFNFINSSKYKPFVMFRAFAPDHFENHEWFNGGTCNRTVPFIKGQEIVYDLDRMMRNIELEEFKNVSSHHQEGLKLKLLDIMEMSLLRPDGHPGPYRYPHPFANKPREKVQNDCLHWCLPGPIDDWNDLIMEMLINGDEL